MTRKQKLVADLKRTLSFLRKKQKNRRLLRMAEINAYSVFAQKLRGGYLPSH